MPTTAVFDRWDGDRVTLLTDGPVVVGFVVPRTHQTGAVSRRHVLLAVDTIERLAIVPQVAHIVGEGVHLQLPLDACVAHARRDPDRLCHGGYTHDTNWVVRVAGLVDDTCTPTTVDDATWRRFFSAHPLTVRAVALAAGAQIGAFVTHCVRQMATLLDGETSQRVDGPATKAFRLLAGDDA